MTMPPSWHSLMFAVLVALISGVVWLIRLEAKVTYLERVVEKQIEAEGRLQDNIDRHFTRLESKLDKITMRCTAFHSDYPGIIPKLDENGRD